MGLPPLTSTLSAVRAGLHFPPIWRETRTPRELARLLTSDAFRAPDPGLGGGRPVLLIPGFLAGDGSLNLMTTWLRRSGFRAQRTGIRLNVNCSAQALDALELRLEALVKVAGRPATLIGQSRGGTLARALAVRRPELVETVVALGAPQLDPLAVHPLILLQVGAVGALGTLGVPGLFTRNCWDGECCQQFRESFDQPFPDGVRYVAIYSRSDGIVHWRACLDPDAQHVEIEASHIGMAVNLQAYRAVAAALQPPAADDAFEPVRLAA
jgi:pimeloyl-ACP methyl ester carboxylesterase